VIAEGIAAEDRVVVGGLQRAIPGSKVAPQEAARPPATPAPAADRPAAAATPGSAPADARPPAATP
jgi:hypothetical protein